MRKLMLACALALFPLAARAQVTDTTRADTVDRADEPPSELAQQVVGRYNWASLRISGDAVIGPDEVIEGDVGVLEGPLVLAGQVTGSVLAINADVALDPTARIGGDLVVVGGTVRGLDTTRVRGRVQTHPGRLRVREEDGRLLLEEHEALAERWSRWLSRRDQRRSRFQLLTARTYNRVEGLPVLVGPRLDFDTGFGSVLVEAFGIVRSADGFEWDSENLGHSLRTELRFGDDAGLSVGGRLYDAVAPVQDWELTDAEVGLASFLLHRDYRDYFDRHGGAGYVALNASRATSLTLSYGAERWGARSTRDPWTLFRNSQDWRPNPAMDEGHAHLVNATLLVDTRNDPVDPQSGWYATADFEIGRGDIQSFGATAPLARTATAPADVRWRRALLDVRRYNRIAVDGQLNLRLVLGGWVGGDELPLQRRFSLGGPGSLPGFDFRSAEDAAHLQCGTGVAGLPGQCERMALVQVEYSGSLDLDLAFSRARASEWAEWGFDPDVRWVVFADAGRGWLVGPRAGTMQYPSDALPGLSTFETDVGVGLDLGVLGVYIAKSLSDGDEPANFFVRVRRRF